MGYTRYWKITKQEIFDDKFVDDVLNFLYVCVKHGIVLRNWDGVDKPCVNKMEISFNGDRYTDSDCETFRLSATDKVGTLDYCKTGRYPYDAAVAGVIAIAEQYGYLEVDKDGDGDNDQETVDMLLEESKSKLLNQKELKKFKNIFLIRQEQYIL